MTVVDEVRQLLLGGLVDGQGLVLPLYDTGERSGTVYFTLVPHDYSKTAALEGEVTTFELKVKKGDIPALMQVVAKYEIPGSRVKSEAHSHRAHLHPQPDYVPVSQLNACWGELKALGVGEDVTRKGAAVLVPYGDSDK